MGDAIGKICPYCRTELNETDDIVVCNDCEMPHHKDCWVENQGCTTFGCTGTIQDVSIDTPALASGASIGASSESGGVLPVYCGNCGSRNQSDYEFCNKCGNLLRVNSPIYQSPVQVQAYQSIPIVNPHETGQANQSQEAFNLEAQYIGRNAGYYQLKFQVMRIYQKKGCWNWCSFLFTPYWCIYRGMFGLGAGTLAISIVCLLIGGPLTSILSFAMYLTFGIMGNFFYMKHVEKLIYDGYRTSGCNNSWHIEKYGGVKVSATVLAVIFYWILLICIQY